MWTNTISGFQTQKKKSKQKMREEMATKADTGSACATAF